jgi:hypothetical protein
MYTGYVQTPDNSHGERRPSYIETLLVGIFGYNMGGHMGPFTGERLGAFRWLDRRE